MNNTPSAKDPGEMPRPASDPAAVRRIWVKLALIALVIGIAYVQATYFKKPAAVAENENHPTTQPEVGPRNIAPSEVEAQPPSETETSPQQPAINVEGAEKPTSTNSPTKPSVPPSNSDPSNPRPPSTSSKNPGQTSSAAENKPTSNPNRPTTPPPAKPKPTGVYVEGKIAYNVVLKDLNDRVVFRGEVDLTKTLDRVAKGTVISEFQHDGIIFRNRERRLPVKTEGYYREWVHPTPQIRGPGPQRIVTGRSGDTWYTPDHYGHFYQVKP